MKHRETDRLFLVRNWTMVLLLVMTGALAFGGCSTSRRVSPSDGDGDGDVDGDGDGDVDGDVDGDIDGDGDGDGDGDADYVVHEWGVFTEGGAHGATRTFGGAMADKPVLYFYADEPVTVDVEVELVGGRAHETWPEIELSDVLRWPGVEIEPTPCSDHTPFPDPGQGQCENPWDWWCEATELPRYTVPEASCLSAEDTTSPLLFYAGAVGEAPMLLDGDHCHRSYEPSPDEPGELSVMLYNQHDERVGPVFMIYRNVTGLCEFWGCQIDRAVIHAQWIDSIGPGESLSLSAIPTLLTADPGQQVNPPEWLMEEERSLVAMLEDEGLTEAEAEALMAGWNHVILDLQPDDNMISLPYGESLLLVYPVPRAEFDRALPIRFDPPPRALERVGLSLQFLDRGCDLDS